MQAHKFANIFPMMEGKDFNNLKEDIRENGFDRERPIILFDDKILDGRNRYKACKELKIEPTFTNYTGKDALYYVISNNLNRRQLNESQRAMVGVEYKKHYTQLYPQGRPEKGGTSATFKEKETKNRDKAGKAVGVSGKMIDMAESVQKEATKEEIKDITQGKIKVSAVYKKYKKKKQAEEIKKLIPEKEIQGVYDVIVIDPPWDFDQTFDDEGNRGLTDYPTMKPFEIAKIKLPTAKDAVIWLWVTNQRFREAFSLLETWGFEPKTILTWDKVNMGVGRYLRNITEHCILAFKGKPYFDNKKWTTLLSEKRTTHSTKPEIFYKMVDNICAGRKLDYFARKKRNGWDTYGVDVQGN